MSHIVTIAGVDVSECLIEGVRFVPILEAGGYVKSLAAELSALDGSPLYVCGSTLDDIVDTTEEVLEETGSLDGTPLLSLLQFCDRTGAVLRVWWAGPLEVHLDVVGCKTIAEATEVIASQAFQCIALRFAP